MSLVSKSVNVTDMIANHDWLRRRAGSEYGQSKIYIHNYFTKIKDQLKEENAPSEYKYLADQYLNKILDYVETFRY